jgi:hypothetical protein
MFYILMMLFKGQYRMFFINTDFHMANVNKKHLNKNIKKPNKYH